MDEAAIPPTEEPHGTGGPPPKRRWYQFSLRAMFVWVTVIAVGPTVGHHVDYPGDTRWCDPEPLEL